MAEDEAKHFSLLKTRLEELGSYYGAHTVHAGLWESALDTQDDLLARLAIIHLVHEARGLDVSPGRAPNKGYNGTDVGLACRSTRLRSRNSKRPAISPVAR